MTDSTFCRRKETIRRGSAVVIIKFYDTTRRSFPKFRRAVKTRWTLNYRMRFHKTLFETAAGFCSANVQRTRSKLQNANFTALQSFFQRALLMTKKIFRVRQLRSCSFRHGDRSLLSIMIKCCSTQSNHCCWVCYELAVEVSVKFFVRYRIWIGNVFNSLWLKPIPSPKLVMGD